MAQRVQARDCSFTTMGLKEPFPLTSLSTVLLRTAGCTQRADGSAFTLRLSGCVSAWVCLLAARTLTPGLYRHKIKTVYFGPAPTRDYQVLLLVLPGTQRCSSHRCAVHRACHGYFPGFPLMNLKESPSQQAELRMAPDSLDPRHLKQPFITV